MLNPSAGDILSGRITAKTSLFNLLMALPLNTEVREAINLEILREPKSFKDYILKNAVKNNQLKEKCISGSDINFENLSAYYFLDNDNANNFSKHNGIVCKGPSFKCDSFYNDCTITDLPISDSWDPIQAHIPPVNAMLIIDKYIFSPLEKKLSNLISFIKLYKNKLDIPFHLSILFSSEIKGKTNCTPSQIQKAFDEIQNIGNIEVRLYSDNNISTHDRLIFTNYTSGNIGIPFDNRDTRFTQNFIGVESSHEKIIKNYFNYKEDILKFQSYLSKIPKQMGSLKSIWETSTFSNRLFEPFCKK